MALLRRHDSVENSRGFVHRGVVKRAAQGSETRAGSPARQLDSATSTNRSSRPTLKCSTWSSRWRIAKES